MVKPQLPLHATLSDGTPITITARDIAHLTQLAGWDGFDPAAAEVLQPLGLTVPQGYTAPTHAPGATAWRIAPDRLLIETALPFAPPSSDALAVLDLSDARICLRLEGQGAAALLARVAAIDFSDAAFPPGDFVQTGMHKIGTLIQRHQTGYDVFLPVTWSQSVISHWCHHLGA